MTLVSCMNVDVVEQSTNLGMVLVHKSRTILEAGAGRGGAGADVGGAGRSINYSGR